MNGAYKKHVWVLILLEHYMMRIEDRIFTEAVVW